MRYHRIVLDLGEPLSLSNVISHLDQRWPLGSVIGNHTRSRELTDYRLSSVKNKKVTGKWKCLLDSTICHDLEKSQRNKKIKKSFARHVNIVNIEGRRPEMK